MSKKRRQRSTTIRKRIEKKQREDEKRQRKAAKLAGGSEDVVLRVSCPREPAERCAEALGDLAQRLAEAPQRGWTLADIEDEFGLGWLADLLGEALVDESDPLEFDIPEQAKRHLLDRLGVLEMAAPGLQVDWEVGFGTLVSAVGRAEEVVPEEEGPAPIPPDIARLFDQQKKPGE